jgi:hypothetical protein
MLIKNLAKYEILHNAVLAWLFVFVLFRCVCLYVKIEMTKINNQTDVFDCNQLNGEQLHTIQIEAIVL